MKHKLFIGGLMRCCLQTIEAHDDSEDKEDTVVPCKWCSDRIILKNDHWQWDHKPYQGEERRERK